MAKAVAPLFSLKASGDLGPIQYACGRFVKKKQRAEESEPTAPQGEQRAKFLEGADKWSNVLSLTNRGNWTGFFVAIKNSKECASVDYLMSSYNLWMLYWLKFGENGWTNYPDPPPR